MKLRSKRYREVVKDLDLGRNFEIPEAVGLLRERSKTKFDESFELAVKLSIDPKQAVHMVRVTLSLP